MIRLIITLMIALFAFVATIFAQDTTTNFVGNWHGQLDVQSTKLRITYHITETNGIYTTTMDSPDQKAFGIPTDKTTITNDSLFISMESMKISYKGSLKDNIITGSFTQGGMSFPLNLSQKELKKAAVKTRPQDPKKPYNYISEDVTFVNKAAKNIKLSGTLTIPKNVKKPAVVVLITGSGPQDRNEELLNHRPFLVLADYLTNNGIAVLRYDDRGVAKSEGTFKDATSADFATDVEAAVAYLQTRTDINTKKIGLIGHSEGGFIAPMVAAKNKKIAFIILLAGTGVDGAKVLQSQTKRAMELADTATDHINFNDKMTAAIYDLVKQENEQSVLKEKMTAYLKEIRIDAPKSIAESLTDVIIEQQVKTITTPWMHYFIKTNPAQFLNKVKCPVLAINGEKDFQVLPKLNLNGIKKALKKSKDVTTIELKGLNHLFQTCETGAFSEYAAIEETFSPKALKVVANWINKRF